MGGSHLIVFRAAVEEEDVCDLRVWVCQCPQATVRVDDQALAYALFALESIVCADAHFVDQTNGVEDVQSDENTQAEPDLLDVHQIEEYYNFVVIFIFTAMILVEV